MTPSAPRGISTPLLWPPAPRTRALAASDFVLQIVQDIEAARPGGVWFDATLHPCLRWTRDDEIAATQFGERIRSFDAQLAWRMFGRRWMNGPALRQRLWGVFVVQRGPTGLVHGHAYCDVVEDRADQVEHLAPDIWRRSAPKGTDALFRRAPDAGWAAYMTRHLADLQQSRQSFSPIFLPVLNSTRPLPFAPCPASPLTHH